MEISIDAMARFLESETMIFIQGKNLVMDCDAQLDVYNSNAPYVSNDNVTHETARGCISHMIRQMGGIDNVVAYEIKEYYLSGD